MARALHAKSSPSVPEGTWDARLIVHDMRTPLNALLLNLQAAALNGRLTIHQKHCLDCAEKNARTLAGLIDEVLSVHTGEMWSRESLSLQRHEPDSLVSQALDQVSGLAAQKSLQLSTNFSEAVPSIVVDGEKIVRVLVNLLTNAIKFTPVNGSVLVSLRLRVNDGHAVVIFSVEDNGMGISDEDVNRIFLQGVSGADSDGKPSTGLGLTVSRQLVEAHGGRIWVEPGRIDGSTFSFSLPVDD